MTKDSLIRIKIDNIHCKQCENGIKKTLSKLASSIKVDEVNGLVTCRTHERIETIWNKLSDSGLDVRDISVLKKGEYQMSEVPLEGKMKGFNEKEHASYCKACEVATTEDKKAMYRARFILGNARDFDSLKAEIIAKVKCEDVHVEEDILTAILPNKNTCNEILNLVRDHNISIQIKDVLPVQTESKYKVTASIGGITCAACASSIKNAVSDLNFVSEIAVNVVTKVGIFILDFDDREKIEELKETVEDCGFIFNMIGEPVLIDHISTKTPTRTVKLKIEGMFCSHCPERAVHSLKDIADTELIIDNSDELSLKHPYIKFTYIPNVEKNVTIRHIIDRIIEELSTGEHHDIKVSIDKDVPLEEHLRQLSKRETLGILKRLIAVTIIAIPTFVFAVVGMSLVPKGNSFRKWVDEPIWAGDTARAVWILFILSTFVYFFVADLFHKKAIKEIYSLWRHSKDWRRKLFRFGSMNLLMSLGTTVAYFSSVALLIISSTKKSQDMSNGKGLTTTYFDSVVFLTFFLMIGRLLESLAKSKTAAAIGELSSFKEETASLLEKNGDQLKSVGTVDVERLDMGDFIRISPGQSPPLDCIIIEGETQFDESALTGESVPLVRIKGDQIFAGTVNVGSNSVIAKVSSFEGESLLDQIVNAVRDGQLNRAPVERLADILTGYFVPLIILCAIVTWIIWLVLGLSGALPQSYLDTDVGGWTVWSLEFAISVFVVACPCGIGLAAPTALFVGSGMAARFGILSRGGGAAFQEGSQVSVVCFDKTGTLTTGNKMKVTNYTLHKNTMLAEIAIEVTRDMETSSRHPLAIGVQRFIEEKFGKSTSTVKIPDPVEISGGGLKGEIILSDDLASDPDSAWKVIEPTLAIIGNERLLRDHNCHLTSEQLQTLAEWKTEGKSVVITAIKSTTYFGNDRFYPVMMCAVRDEIRPEAKQVIAELQGNGIECWMISGDNEITARAIANELNIKNVIAEVLPDEKADKIKWIQKTATAKTNKRRVVAMVGDGVNDAPALAAADVGIALASGSALAMISCDFVLLSQVNTLLSLLALLKLSKKVFNRVKFNFGWALIYNIIALPIAAGAIYPYHNSRLSPVWASAAMALSSVSVVLSSLALRLYNPTRGIKIESKNVLDTQVQGFQPTDNGFIDEKN